MGTVLKNLELTPKTNADAKSAIGIGKQKDEQTKGSNLWDLKKLIV
jgi:hypothetical protein